MGARDTAKSMSKPMSKLMQWEYTTVLATDQQELQKAGLCGWKMVSVVLNPVNGKYVAFMERPIIPTNDSGYIKNGQGVI